MVFSHSLYYFAPAERKPVISYHTPAVGCVAIKRKPAEILLCGVFVNLNAICPFF